MPLPVDPSIRSNLVNLDSLPVMRETTPVVSRDGLLNEAQMRARAAVAVAQDPQAAQPAPTFTAPAQAPAANAAVPIAAAGPEIRPNDPPRFQERINSLYGAKKSAEERAEALERQLQDVLSRLESRPSPQTQAPFTNQYASSPGFQTPANSFDPAQGNPSVAGISRDEVVRLLNEQRQVFAAESSLRNAHIVSRMEAERQFPDVFRDPNIKQIADEIWDRDRTLQFDPHGPEKAALLARGIAYSPGPFSQSATAPASVRKEQISAVGASVPEGSGTPDTLAAQYHAAMERARLTQRPDDFAEARRIQLQAFTR